MHFANNLGCVWLHVRDFLSAGIFSDFCPALKLQRQDTQIVPQSSVSYFQLYVHALTHHIVSGQHCLSNQLTIYIWNLKSFKMPKCLLKGITNIWQICQLSKKHPLTSIACQNQTVWATETRLRSSCRSFHLVFRPHLVFIKILF